MNRAAVREIADLYFERFEARLEQGLATLRAEIREEAARVDAALANQRSELLKWMFIFWVGTLVPLAGLILTLHRL